MKERIKIFGIEKESIGVAFLYVIVQAHAKILSNKTIVDCISPALTLDLVTRGAGPGHTGSYSSLFLYKLFAMYFFCEIEKVTRCLKCNVFFG